jgi:di/tricarboxylate transporter
LGKKLGKVLTFEIALVLIILALTIVLFLSGRLRVDLIGLLVLGSLAITGLVTPAEALSGFSNPAVVTVWAMFIISGGLTLSGVARFIGHQVLRFSGHGEIRLIAVIMLTAGGMSAFMNNIGVAALLLPVVMDIGKRTGHPPSRLLMPLAYGCLLGGLTTLIGTPPNILVSDALREFGLTPFRLFDFTPVGLSVMVGSVLFMILFGRRLLPVRDPAREFSDEKRSDLTNIYSLGERIFSLRLPPGSPLTGKNLASSRLGETLGVNVIGILRRGRTILSPGPTTLLQPEDKLLVVGRQDRLAQLSTFGELQVEKENLDVDRLISSEIEIAKVGLAPESSLIGQTLRESDFRRRFGVNVLSIYRQDKHFRMNLQDIPIQTGDVCLIQGQSQKIVALQNDPDFLVSNVESAEVSPLHEHLLAVRIPDESPLEGKTLAESNLGAALGLMVLGIARDGDTYLAPSHSEKLKTGDILLVEGSKEELQELSGLGKLDIEGDPTSDLEDLETEKVGLVEAVLSPHSTLFGQTLRQIDFRDKYGLSVVAIWRGGRSYRSNLGNMPLQLGDALLLYGNRDRIKRLAREPDFLVLYEEAQPLPDLTKAPRAVVILGLVLLPVMLGWLPISIAAVVGAALMVLTRCLSMEEAYRVIEWRAVFLIAGTLPLGIAMEQTGAASLIADQIVLLVGNAGPMGLLAGIFILTSLSTQAMPSVASVVLLAPIALNTSAELGISPYPLMMAVAIAASTGFHSPVSHPANVLVLGPGGYRYVDFFKVGLPLTAVVFVLVLLVLPIFFPF